VETISFYLEILYCLRTLDILVYHLMKTVEIFLLNLFGLDAYLVQPEENKKSRDLQHITVNKIIYIFIILHIILKIKRLN